VCREGVPILVRVVAAATASGARLVHDARVLVLRGVSCAAVTVAALTTVAVAPASTSSAGAVSVRPVLEAKVLAAVNSLRVSRGLAPVRVNRELSAAAVQHSQEMVQGGYFAHDGVATSYARRLQAYYPVGAHHRWFVGENLVWGSPTISAREAVSLWLHSPKHRANLLRRSWRDVGVSAVHAQAAPGHFQGLDVTVITLDFGRRS
jgi:uncharacterized protein YkwD